MGSTKRLTATYVAAGLIAVAGLGACDSNPAGPILSIQGTYAGTWAFDLFIEGAFVSRAECPGSITLAGQEGRAYGGTFLILDEGDCAGLSPISGEVVNGAVRGDGGVTFGISLVPLVGPGVAGCSIVADPELGGEMTGAVLGDELSVLTIADLNCGIRGPGSAQITMTGTR